LIHFYKRFRCYEILRRAARDKDGEEQI